MFSDGADHWLADGFHRYRALRAAGIEDIPVFIRNGTRRDAVLYSVGAIAHHGLRRTNEDKRKAVQTLLADPERAAWSDREIARACSVVHAFVAKVRAGMPHLDTNPDRPAHLDTNPDSQPASTRTVSRGGKEYQQDTSGVAESNKKRAKPKAEEPSPEEPAEEEGIEQDDVVEALLAENPQLKEESDILNRAAGQAGRASSAAKCRGERRGRVTMPKMSWHPHHPKPIGTGPPMFQRVLGFAATPPHIPRIGNATTTAIQALQGIPVLWRL